MGGLRRRNERDFDELLSVIRFVARKVKAFDSIKDDIKKLKHISKKTIRHVKKLEEQVANLSGQVTDLSGQVTGLTGQVADLEKRVKVIESYDWDHMGDGCY